MYSRRRELNVIVKCFFFRNCLYFRFKFCGKIFFILGMFLGRIELFIFLVKEEKRSLELKVKWKK